VLTFYQKILIAALLVSLGGEIIIYYLKKLLIDPNARFSFDLSGMMERIALLLVIAIGGYYFVLAPFIVLARAVFVLSEGRMKGFADIINREEPAVEFQKIRLKSDLAITLLASPALGILSGITAALF
jgi:hypothetical protein